MAFSSSTHLSALFLAAVLCLAASFIPSVEAQARSENFTIYMHGQINDTDYVVLQGVAGVGSSNLTAQQGPFGSLFVYNEPITVGPDASSEQLGTMQGTGFTTTFDGTTFFVSSTATFFNTTQYPGSFTQSGLSGGRIPITGGIGYFLFAQGYTISSYYAINGFNITYQVNVTTFYPPYY